MPEGDTVLRETDMLKELFSTYPIFAGLIPLNGKYPKLDLDLFEDLLGEPIYDMLCKGKRFFLRLSKDICLTFHHLMGGFWSKEETKNSQVMMKFINDKDDILSLYYNNTRFGGMDLLETEEAYNKMIDKIASGFIGDFILTKEQWRKRIKRYNSKKCVRYALTDQNELCSGIGNYLVAEIMYYSCIHPKATFGDLDDEEIDDLYDMCVQVVSGFYDQELEKVVYGHDVDPFGNQVVIMEMGNNRKAHYVPEVQTIGAK